MAALQERKAGADPEDESMDGSESISGTCFLFPRASWWVLSVQADAYQRALATNIFIKTDPKAPDLDPEQIIPLVLARAGAEKRAIEAGRGDENAFSTLIKVVEDGLVMVRQGR